MNKEKNRMTVWNCQECGRWYTKTIVKDGLIMCPKCDSINIVPKTIYK